MHSKKKIWLTLFIKLIQMFQYKMAHVKFKWSAIVLGKMPPSHPQNQKRRRRMRDTSEVSCCLKYVIFGFNVIFWVIWFYIKVRGFYSIFLVARARCSCYWNLGLDWEGHFQQYLKIDQHCPGPCIYFHMGRGNHICYRLVNSIFGLI